MQVKTTEGLFRAIIEKARREAPGGLSDWAVVTEECGNGSIRIAERDRPGVVHLVSGEIVARGVWRITGWQNMTRPVGWTEEMANQLSWTMSDLDVDHLEPVTVSRLIQVGLFRNIRYQTA